ncbi:hypothetical protein [Dictyobacter arantiisoli]|uniref:DUF6249 domain-containing protein n=1 Tax=Dictyobacter arantiisoli TaxID=2014874 RepID=A0A5A5TCS2_9CHLR|nr:hypothetical protein [Dictyobacter arantiisoli]GCF09320.1 hypothetical protein KDI_28840 [Dictyobacter arantiisoli]
MSYNVLALLLGWLIALILFLGFIALIRYIQHRERMAMITHGIPPVRQRRNRGILRAGLIIMMVGISLTVGLYPLGFVLPTAFTATPLHLGPWLLPGLIPFGVGLALTSSYYLEQSSQSESEEQKHHNPKEIVDEKVISFKEHRSKEQGKD